MIYLILENKKLVKLNNLMAVQNLLCRWQYKHLNKKKNLVLSKKSTFLSLQIENLAVMNKNEKSKIQTSFGEMLVGSLLSDHYPFIHSDFKVYCTVDTSTNTNSEFNIYLLFRLWLNITCFSDRRVLKKILEHSVTISIYFGKI